MEERITILKRKHQFCVKHSKNLARMRNLRAKSEVKAWWKSAIGLRIIHKARKEIGYSPKTIDLDIINSLITHYKRKLC